ncbi:hypothetical protein [Pontibacter sp. G13]|uniref:hypothetical protein n=1 Tax=Pontibacter sp. G13 TaxID=3074898 RepID=UPI00288B498B|nr:hypothetical protein [Pontibacter sp. G13]WNJ17753.1 hypothetical protein RJD25_23115 [Pontibacter sp. G13]
MKRFLMAGIGGFAVNQVVATLLAILILNPWLNEAFGDTIRSAEEGLAFPSLLGGYLVLSLLMAWMFPKMNLQGSWKAKGLVFGAWIGGMVFVAGHLVVAGWSVLPGVPMLFSGLVDSLAAIAAGYWIAYMYRHGVGASR